MSELFGRMLDRAAGRAPTVQAAIAPRVLPGPAITELAVEADAPTHHPAPRPSADRQPAQAATRLASDSAVIAPREPTTRSSASTPAVVPTPSGSDVSLAPQIQRIEDVREVVVHEVVELAATPIAATDVARSVGRAGELAPTILEASEPVGTTPQAVPTMHRVSSVLASMPSEVEEVSASRPDVEAEPRMSRRGPPAAKIDLRDALAAVGRALARPPVQAMPAVSADQDVHISIGHIEVRAPAAAPAPSAPPRRAPSITLADYLRRRPGDGR
jgi:hypothetical protein